MTNEKAIEILDTLSAEYYPNAPEKEALDLAIQVLEQQPCEDCVSRQEFEKRIKPYDTDDKMDKALYNFAHNILISCTLVKPQQKVGRWRHYEGMLICSECGAEFYDDIMEYCGDNVPKCCPDCGADMRGDMNDR